MKSPPLLDSSAPGQFSVSSWEAFLPLAALLVFVVLGTGTVGLGTEVLVLAMLGAAAVAGLVALRHGASWDEIQRRTGAKVAAVLPMLLILLAIGLLIGCWVLSGTIPLLIHWGIRLIDPRFFVLTTFLVTALMSLCTGTSWGSAGTLGVALMGAAGALDIPLAPTAGAVLSGAYFGDKISPLSDSTNICALSAGTDLYAHIRHLLYTAVPSFLVAAGVYAWVGGASADGGELPASALRLLLEIDSVYRLGFVPLIPLLVVLAGIAWKRPAALVLAVASLLALIIGVAYQGFRTQDAVFAAVTGFQGSMVSSLGLDPEGLNGEFLRLLERGGLNSMAPTLVLILSAFLLAGAMEASGSLQRIARSLLNAVHSTFGLIAATLGAGASVVALTSHCGVTALVVGELFQEAYRERSLAPENLSRSLEDSVTIFEPLLPWTVSGLFMATTLGVPTLSYAPWAVFCYGGAFFSLLIAATGERTGWGLRRRCP